MKVLWLGNSQDIERGELALAELAPNIIADRLATTFGEEVDLEIRSMWPTEVLPGLVERWMEKSKPDMVLLIVPAFWCCMESVPLKVQRKFGRLGKPIADAGLKVADTSWLSSNPVYWAARGLAMRTIGGSNHFSPQEVVDRMEECIRIIVRYEDTTLLVQGLQGLDAHYTTPTRRARAEKRRYFVDKQLRSLCEALHITYDGIDTEAAFHPDPSLRIGDRAHLNAAGQVAVADDLTPRFERAWADHDRRDEGSRQSDTNHAPGTDAVRSKLRGSRD